MKIVYNSCFGGFGLSEAGYRRYAEIIGVTLYPEHDNYGMVTWWTVPEGQRTGILSNNEFLTAALDARAASNMRYAELQLYARDLDRTDPALVQVVEELGAAANGDHAELRIAEIPSGQRYRIDEYDGSERVMTVDDYDWQIAS